MFTCSEIDTLIAILGLILTVVTTIIAFIDICAVMKENKMNNLALSHKLLGDEYWDVYDRVLKFYDGMKKRLKFLNDENVIISPMIYKKNWINFSAKINKISNVELRYDDKSKRKNKKLLNALFQIRLPYPRKTFEQNVSLVCNNNSMFNNRIYALVNYKEDNGKITLDITDDRYYSFINTCVRMSHADAYADSHFSCKRKFIRRRIDPFDFLNRVPTVGIVTLTILYNVKSEDDNTIKNHFILHRRSNNVTECKNMINVIPAGIYQPTFNSNYQNPDPIEYTVFREFGEELLGKKEFTELNSINEIS